ncbi:MAG: hypothetical protein JAY77_03230 [Candidatus Thiodiazotropha taylori]|uniref:Uncharacterized protein n=1 Tax=Candidatus Thiodiazotropha taylori TaxID=2792791 RepID=A0A9E4NH21_9GAMM|nr:hypothetical protein [Candidatus Thiodiazotropha taylori]
MEKTTQKILGQLFERISYTKKYYAYLTRQALQKASNYISDQAMKAAETKSDVIPIGKTGMTAEALTLVVGKSKLVGRVSFSIVDRSISLDLLQSFRNSIRSGVF